MNLGDTFFPVRPDGRRGHLRVVVSHPNADGESVSFSLTSKKKGDPACDTTCILKKGDHRFVKHDTVVDYARGTLLPLAAMYAASPDEFEMDTPVRPDVLRRIQEAALKSGNVADNERGLIRQAMGQPRSVKAKAAP